MHDENSLLLVGASGLVGRMVLRAWRADPPIGWTVTAQYRRPEGKTGSACIVWDPVTQPPPMGLHAEGRPSVMCVLAGVTPRTGTDLNDNIRIALRCLDAAVELGIGRVLLASSSAVYRPGRLDPIPEGEIPQPQNDYGCAKLAMEQAVADHAVRSGLETCCLRIGNVLGADALLLNARSVEASKSLLLDRFADGGGPIRSYIDPVTLADVLLSLADAPVPLPPILNVGCPQPVSMQSIADAAGIAWQWHDAGPQAHQTITLDCSALAKFHDFRPDSCTPTGMVQRLRRLEAML